MEVEHGAMTPPVEVVIIAVSIISIVMIVAGNVLLCGFVCLMRIHHSPRDTRPMRQGCLRNEM